MIICHHVKRRSRIGRFLGLLMGTMVLACFLFSTKTVLFSLVSSSKSEHRLNIQRVLLVPTKPRKLKNEVQRNIQSHRYLESYFIPRENKVNPHNYSFIIPAEGLCKGERPYILACVPSVYNHESERQVIRKTWGSVVRTGVWADGSLLPPIKLMFIIGTQKDKDVEPILRNESVTYGDIVLANFIDSYANLTIKSMSILKWMITFCPDAQYVLKNDEDALVNLPGMVKFLQDRKPEGIVGKPGYQLKVVRDGIKKWIVPKEEYPPDFYPPYILGNFYLIANSAVSLLYETSQYIPFLSMEDIFITGVVRLAAGLTLERLGKQACLYHCTLNDTTLLGYTIGNRKIERAWGLFREQKLNIT